MFKVPPAKLDINQSEKEILEYWKKNKIFEKTQKPKKGQKRFVFYEGPPTANGKPGIHHVMARAFKDVFPRYKTMKGYFCLRKGGWDTHGLPVELEVEKHLGLSGKKQIEEYGIAKFNQKCRESVWKYVADWETLTERIGFWLDTQNPYITMDKNYIESCWWIFRQLWDKKLLKKDYKVLPYCYRCQTPLSSHEVAQGYKDVTEDSVYIKFESVDEPKTYYLAWTTTPWTLLGNVALAINPKATYVKAKAGNETLILAKDRFSVLNGKKYEISEEIKGEKLVGKHYKPLFDYIKYDKKVHYLISADFVLLDEGTGIVHTAVMYGEEDFNLGRKFGLPEHHVVKLDGTFNEENGPYSGLSVKKDQVRIVEDLDKKGVLFKVESITHAYPHCWRCDTPLLYYALDSWFILTTKKRLELIKQNNKVNWYPVNIKKGRMGNWLESLIDWSVSRSRYWGTPLPIWHCDSCKNEICVGSFKEIEELGGKMPDDPHRPFIDEVELNCPKCQKKMVRIAEVADCWFDSGAMPVAQWHYPFENKDTFKDQFPADFISEAIDQTRGWFYTLMAESTLVLDQNSYKNVVCNGLVLDEKGAKMSKHIGNVVDPWYVIGETGADALRWYFYSAVKSGENYRFALKNVKDINARVFLVLWNVYKFFVLYANSESWTKNQQSKKSENLLDKWIISKINRLIREVDIALEDYNAYDASNKIGDFIEDLSNWYVRRSRDRIGSEFYDTTYKILDLLSRVISPLAPFFAEKLFLELNKSQSVHLSSWPVFDEKLIDQQLESDMKLVREICELGHRARKEANIKVRQPLAKVIIYRNNLKLDDQLLNLIKDELNIKKIEKKPGKKEINLMVDLDKKITPELKAEGDLRDLVRQIQELRKQAGCKLSAKIKVYLPNVPTDKNATLYLKKQTLAEDLIKAETLRIEVLD